MISVATTTALGIMQDSQQLMLDNGDKVSPKPASSTPRHSIDAILGLAGRKRKMHQEYEDSKQMIDSQDNTGRFYF